MEEYILNFIIGLVSCVFGGIISYLTCSKQCHTQINVVKEQCNSEIEKINAQIKQYESKAQTDATMEMFLGLIKNNPSINKAFNKIISSKIDEMTKQ